MAVLIVAWRLVQDYVNSPRSMGRSLKLPPLVVLVGFMIGGQVGGIAGIYLSVPIVAVLRTVWLDYIFFFQAEDGIRDLYVTGVQTCALPIWPDEELHAICEARLRHAEAIVREDDAVLLSGEADLMHGHWRAGEVLLDPHARNTRDRKSVV